MEDQQQTNVKDHQYQSIQTRVDSKIMSQKHSKAKLRQTNLYILLVINLITNSGMSLLAPFYPDLADQKGLDSSEVGLVFGILNVGAFVSAIIFGKMMQFWGRKLIICIGLILICLTTFTYGIIEYIDNRQLFLVISIVARLVQGVGCSAYSSIAYAYIPILFPESIEEKISYMEVTTGLGYMLGPLLGTLLFMLGNYCLPFYVFTGLFLLSIPISTKMLPNDDIIRKMILNDNPSSQNQEDQQNEPLQIIKFVRNYRFVMTFLLIIISYQGVSFLLPILSGHLHQFGITEQKVGFFYIIPTLSYSLNMLVISRFPKHVDRKVWLILGMLILFFSFIFLGPEKYSYLPSNIYIVCTGLLLLGIGTSITMVPCIPELIAIGKTIYTQPQDYDKVGDMASGFFQFSLNVSGFFGPIISGLLNKYFQFNRGCTIMGLVIFGYVLIYFLTCDGLSAFKTIFITDKEEIERRKQKNSQDGILSQTLLDEHTHNDATQISNQ